MVKGSTLGIQEKTTYNKDPPLQPPLSGEDCFDFLKNAVDILKVVFILETHYFDAECGEKIRPFEVVFLTGLRKVLTAVEFDSEAGAEAEEIKNVGSLVVLAGEFMTEQTFQTQILPQPFFSFRLVASQFSATIEEDFSVAEDIRHLARQTKQYDLTQ